MLAMSQNKKIALSAVGIFLVSFSAMIFFLQKNGGELGHGSADILGATGHHGGGHSEIHETVEDPEKLIAEAEMPGVLIDVEGKIEISNEQFCKFLGVDCEEINGRSLFNLINTRDLPEFVQKHSRMIRNGEEAEGIGPFRMATDNGEKVVLFTAKPVMSDGHVENVVLIIKDISALVDAIKTEKDENWGNVYPNVEVLRGEELKKIVDKISFAD